MASKRVPLRRSAKAKLTPEVVGLWVKLRELRDDRMAYHLWEHEGGRHREYLDSNRDLCRRLGLDSMADFSPLDAHEVTPPDYVARNPLRADSWRAAWLWRCALIEAEEAGSL